jgi:hypothetical protein
VGNGNVLRFLDLKLWELEPVMYHGCIQRRIGTSDTIYIGILSRSGKGLIKIPYNK